jgi:hypothetical protein
MIPSVTELGTFGPSCTALFVSQVTTGYDPVLTPKVLSAFADMKGLILAS